MFKALDKKIWKKMVSLLAIFLVLTLLGSCMPGPNELRNIDPPEAKAAGFWQGLWHGFIAFITFIVSLFNQNVNVYEVHNNGGWYNFGFIFGVMIAFGSGGAGSRGAYKHRKKVKIEDIQ
ncbi:MAG: hypothetical protein JXR70_18530 [Spirochaetales bacterium]|nr:hypothetical protein [Spirochaetales bacterium]